MKSKKDYRLWIVIISIFFLGIMVILGLRVYINAFFLAIIFGILTKPIYRFFTKKGLKSGTSAILVLIIDIFLIIFAVLTVGTIIINQAQSVLEDTPLSEVIPDIDSDLTLRSFWEMITSFDRDVLQNVAGRITTIFAGIVGGFFEFIILATIFLYLLYYFLLIDGEKFEMKVKELSPFNQKNTQKLISEFESVTRASIITTILIALMQAIFMTISLIFLQVPNALFWGFITFFAAFLPAIGTGLIWVPISIYYFLTGEFFTAAGVLIAGMILSTADNIIRPIVQRGIGEIHAIIVLLGAFMGLTLFGLIGVIVGPLLFNYFVLLIKIFAEEYM